MLLFLFMGIRNSRAGAVERFGRDAPAPGLNRRCSSTASAPELNMMERIRCADPGITKDGAIVSVDGVAELLHRRPVEPSLS